MSEKVGRERLVHGDMPDGQKLEHCFYLRVSINQSINQS